MTNTGHLSTTAGSAAGHPLSLLHNHVPFNIASANTPPRSYLKRPRSVHSLPNWTRLGTGAATADAADRGAVASPLRDSAAANAASRGLETTYSDPREASAAYRSGLLKSDFNISSSHPSMRLAFRYLLADEGSVGNGDEEEDDERNNLFLCWIRQDGVPCHFRTMRPVCSNNTPAAVADDANNDDVGSAAEGDEQASENNTLLVNERDHIETTKPGHAFVFCRRVEYHHSDTEDASQNETRNENDPTVVTENGKTYFLRKRRRNQEEESSDGSEDDWEAFLVVGGYRPGVMPEIKEGDQYTDRVQLVTIQSVRASAGMGGINSTNPETETDDEKLPPEKMDCSSCTRSVPFLRGANRTVPFLRGALRTPAFVATNSNDGGAGLNIPPQLGRNQTDNDRAMEVTVCISQLDATPLDTSDKHYDVVVLGGWPCRAEPGCFPADMDVPENGHNLLRSRFEADLAAASRALPPAARARLMGSTPVWINRSQSYGPRSAPVRGRHGCFHPGSEWLVRNGMSPKKCGGVEWYDARNYLSDCDLWGPGGLMLHELSHAWHCLHIEDGYDNEEIIDVYKKAMEDGLYDCVLVHGSQGPQCKAYACQDQMEYFAELSVAFLGGLDKDREHNKWYPFNRAQVREHDPRAFAMLCRMWGVEGDTLGDEPSSSKES